VAVPYKNLQIGMGFSRRPKGHTVHRSGEHDIVAWPIAGRRVTSALRHVACSSTLGNYVKGAPIKKGGGTTTMRGEKPIATHPGKGGFSQRRIDRQIIEPRGWPDYSGSG